MAPYWAIAVAVSIELLMCLRKDPIHEENHALFHKVLQR